MREQVLHETVQLKRIAEPRLFATTPSQSSISQGWKPQSDNRVDRIEPEDAGIIDDDDDDTIHAGCQEPASWSSQPIADHLVLDVSIKSH